MLLPIRRKRFRAMIFLLIIAVCIVLFLIGITPRIREYCDVCVSARASQAVGDAVANMLEDGEVDYSKIILPERTVQGNITALRTDMAETNRLKAVTLRAIDAEIADIAVSDLGMPLGTLLFPIAFSGMGPQLPIRILTVSNSSAEFSGDFSSAGINQTLHKIFLDVDLTISVWTPIGTQSVHANTRIPVAETVIVGSVPNSFLQI